MILILKAADLTFNNMSFVGRNDIAQEKRHSSPSKDQQRRQKELREQSSFFTDATVRPTSKTKEADHDAFCDVQRLRHKEASSHNCMTDTAGEGNPVPGKRGYAPSLTEKEHSSQLQNRAPSDSNGEETAHAISLSTKRQLALRKTRSATDVACGTASPPVRIPVPGMMQLNHSGVSELDRDSHGQGVSLRIQNTHRDNDSASDNFQFNAQGDVDKLTTARYVSKGVMVSPGLGSKREMLESNGEETTNRGHLCYSSSKPDATKDSLACRNAHRLDDDYVPTANAKPSEEPPKQATGRDVDLTMAQWPPSPRHHFLNETNPETAGFDIRHGYVSQSQHRMQPDSPRALHMATFLHSTSTASSRGQAMLDIPSCVSQQRLAPEYPSFRLLTESDTYGEEPYRGDTAMSEYIQRLENEITRTFHQYPEPVLEEYDGCQFSSLETTGSQWDSSMSVPEEKPCFRYVLGDSTPRHRVDQQSSTFSAADSRPSFPRSATHICLGADGDEMRQPDDFEMTRFWRPNCFM